MGSVALEDAADNAAAAGRVGEALTILERAVEEDPTSEALWLKFSAMLKVGGDLRRALLAAERALSINPLNFAALLHRAMLLEALGDPSAGPEFGNALAQLRPGTEVPASFAHAVAHARKRWAHHQQELEEKLLRSLPDRLSSFERMKAERLISNRSRRTKHYHQEPTDFHYPGMPEFEFHEKQAFPRLSELEAATEKIAAEFAGLLAAEATEVVPYIQYPERIPLRQWRELNNDQRWSAIHLLQNGHLIESNARHCPTTIELLSRLPQPKIRNASPNAMFSLLAPRTHIPPHSGVANTRLVCHLPLIVPPSCGFRVGGTTRQWRRGEAFVFDDTIEHEAWNDSDELRVVLIFDLWAPSLGASERNAIGALLEAAGVGPGI